MGMNMTKHTPGPWTAVPVESGAKRRDLVYVKIQSERSLAYANVGARDGEVAGAYAELPAGRSRGVTISPAEALANARLIAQAPAMLDVLKAIEEYFGDMPKPTFCRDVRAILAAVEGR